ncbi:suppressor of cytokine signaling 3b isoform 1-T3 [Menidia menidia]
MVAFGGLNPPAMSGAPPPVGRVQGSGFSPHHYKTFQSNEQYQQVIRALHKLQKSGFYWGPIGGREASKVLRSESPGTFLVRDSSDHHYFFTLSVQTARGTRNLRIHNEGGGFFLQPDPQNTQELPRFDCVLHLIEHYMGIGPENRGEGNSGEAKMKSHTSYWIHSDGEKMPLELLRPRVMSFMSLQHICRRTLNSWGLSVTAEPNHLPRSLQEFLEEYDSPI